MELKSVKDKVEFVLEYSTEARNDDSKLYWLVCDVILRENGKRANDLTFGEAMRHRASLGLPTFESVRRARQKAVKEHPEYQCDPVTRRLRDKKQQEYYDFAKSCD